MQHCGLILALTGMFNMLASILSVAMISLSSLFTDPLSYREAIAAGEKEGKPVVIVVGSSWCPPCQRLKQTIVSMNDRSVILAYVDIESDKEVANALMEGSTIPQLIIYRKDHIGWRRVRTIGIATKERVAEMLNMIRRKR